MGDSFTDILGAIAGSSIHTSAVSNPNVLNEAYAYAKPSFFSRGMRIDLGELTILVISGTAGIDEHGNSIHTENFRAQMLRTPITSPALVPAREPHDTTSCAPPPASATSIATTKLSTQWICGCGVSVCLQVCRRDMRPGCAPRCFGSAKTSSSAAALAQRAMKIVAACSTTSAAQARVER
jgi:hypothetical protein